MNKSTNAPICPRSLLKLDKRGKKPSRKRNISEFDGKTHVYKKKQRGSSLVKFEKPFKSLDNIPEVYSEASDENYWESSTKSNSVVKLGDKKAQSVTGDAQRLNKMPKETKKKITKLSKTKKSPQLVKNLLKDKNRRVRRDPRSQGLKNYTMEDDKKSTFTQKKTSIISLKKKSSKISKNPNFKDSCASALKRRSAYKHASESSYSVSRPGSAKRESSGNRKKSSTKTPSAKSTFGSKKTTLYLKPPKRDKNVNIPFGSSERATPQKSKASGSNIRNLLILEKAKKDKVIKPLSKSISRKQSQKPSCERKSASRSRVTPNKAPRANSRHCKFSTPSSKPSCSTLTKDHKPKCQISSHPKLNFPASKSRYSKTCSSTTVQSLVSSTSPLTPNSPSSKHPGHTPERADSLKAYARSYTYLSRKA
ncbi:unnamed protein product [Moneuplotes crassus]|uniref:Uncharacterized protein n=1 Tax=Euplotes crassus TaxID=5936 RepID=A0AAD1XBQ5_EUPCR|nr:unnamed protein product [Moneuplotes crassus]